MNGGLNNSKRGFRGSGVYMTECKADIYIFEVLESVKLQSVECNSLLDLQLNDTPLNNLFNKHVRKKSPHIHITEENYKKSGRESIQRYCSS